jgi:elongation factor P
MWEERPVGIELPQTVDMRVVETEPAIKGASVSNVGKPAKMETGLMVQVPPFINEGDLIRIDTATGAYVERAGR